VSRGRHHVEANTRHVYEGFDDSFDNLHAGYDPDSVWSQGELIDFTLDLSPNDVMSGQKTGLSCSWENQAILGIVVNRGKQK
jgi:hypothetical protein